MLNNLRLLNLIVIVCFVGLSLQAQRYNGQTLYATQNGNTAILMDSNQVTLKTWNFNLADKTGYSTHMIPGGTLVRAVTKTGNSFTGGPICGKVQKVDYNGNIVWDYVYSTTSYCSHHDICPMPNGNVLLIAYERRSAAEATAAGANNAIEMWPDKIVEIQPTGATTGNVVWEWKAWDHTMQNVDPSKPNYVSNLAEHPERLNINYKQAKDWLHMNGVDYNPILDQITFSSHNLNEWYIIDHSTTTAEAATSSGGNSGKGGDILYRWGNPLAYGAPGTAVLNVTHDAHFIPEGVPNAGRLAGFNNRGVSNTISAADEIILPRVGYNYTITPGQAFSPASYTKRHACSGGTSNMGSTQQLPNGNQLICIALSGKIYEVTANDAILWTKIAGGSVSQSKMYSPCYVSNQAPALPTISASGNVLTSSSGATYQWYKNGDPIAGATNATYNATSNGVYVVRITDANGCFYQYSTGYRVASFPNDVAFIDLSKQSNVYPNPSEGLIRLSHVDVFGRNPDVVVYDMQGKLVYSSLYTQEINLTYLPNGFYSIRVRGESGQATYKIQILH